MEDVQDEEALRRGCGAFVLLTVCAAGHIPLSRLMHLQPIKAVTCTVEGVGRAQAAGSGVVVHGMQNT